MTTELNESVDYPDAYVIDRVWFYLVGIAGSVLGCAGLVCNVLTIGVLLHAQMRRNTCTVYLTGLVTYDTLFLLLNTAFFSLEYVHSGITGCSDWYQAYVMPAVPVVNVFMDVTVTGSAYTTIALSIDRCVGVRRPFEYSKVCTARRARLVLGCVFVWACILNVPLLMDSRMVPPINAGANQTIPKPLTTKYTLIFSDTTTFGKVYLRYINPIFDGVLPVVSIVVVNIIIGITIRHRQLMMRSMSADGRGSELVDKCTIRVTLKVVIISIFTLIARALRMSTFFFIERHGTATFRLCSLSCGVIAALSNFWNILNATINFFLHFYFGERFRKCFLEIYRCDTCSQSESTSQHLYSSTRGATDRPSYCPPRPRHYTIP